MLSVEDVTWALQIRPEVRHLLSSGQDPFDLQLHRLLSLPWVLLLESTFLLCLVIMAPMFSVQL